MDVSFIKTIPAILMLVEIVSESDIFLIVL